MFLDEEELALAKEFIDAHTVVSTGVIGGQFSYSYTPTTLGTVIVIRDNISGETKDITNYSLW